MSVDISKIQRAFSPAEEIQDPELFVGRQEQIRDAMVSLTNNGSFIAVYGLRGVGKSSIANQIRLIAEGNDRLPRMLSLTKYLPKNGFRNIVQHVTCDSSTHTTLDLLKRIVFGDSARPSLFDLTKAGDRRLDALKEVMEGSAGAGLFGVQLGSKGSREKTYKSYVSDDLVQQFKQLLGTIQKDNQDKTGLLIIVDEFDTFPDKANFSSIVKTASSDFVKFCVVGIANSVTELVQGHSSIGRKIESIEVDRMPEYELDDIISRAEFRVGKEITFEPTARKAIVSQSEGFPYFTHLLGRESMLIAFGRDASVVDDLTIDELVRRITNGRLRTIYEEIYHAAVKNSPQREILLKLFAECSGDELFTEDVYRNAKEMDISNPSHLMKELTERTAKSEPILVKVREKYYRFSDPVFKVYSRIRSWKFA